MIAEGEMSKFNDIIIENDQIRLVVGSDGITKSLVCKSTYEECLAVEEEIAIFSVTHSRPFNNEVKLAHPNKETTFQANSIKREGNHLIVGFEVITDKAIVEIKEAPNYIYFSLKDFILEHEDYAYLKMTPPPVTEFRFMQLPVRNKKNFGEWMNVSWDDKTAVSVIATSPYARVDFERRKSFRLLNADAVKNVKLRGTGAALVVSPTNKFLDIIDEVERDFNLPRGVESRRGDMINASYYWSSDCTPENVDEHINFAKQGGFRTMLLYYTCIFETRRGYGTCGNYDACDYRKEYPNGRADLVAMLDKIKAAGITPGIHFLQTFIGFVSRYITPVVDPRVNLTRHFTLARPFSENDTVIYTEENPEDSVMNEPCRVLRIGGELVTYTGYSTEPPYCFTGVEHGAYETNIGSYPAGLIFGILDVCEFGATSVYINQYTNLQDEIADKLADVYNAGFRFVYYDGSEGTNPPYDFHVPNAQYRVFKKLSPAPLFTEGAAKAHFSWHFLSGGNAFDVFPPKIFKNKIRQFPCEEAPRMAQDFTRLNFGWWGYWVPGASSRFEWLTDNGDDPNWEPGTQPDMFEFGTSRAAAWDCPIALQVNLAGFAKHPRTPDNFEVLRRWEEVRANKWLTQAQKDSLKDVDQEHILLINEQKDYELIPYYELTTAAGGNKNVRVFTFTRCDGNYAVYWHASGGGELELPLASNDAVFMDEIGEIITVQSTAAGVKTPICKRRYVKTQLPMDELVKAFEQAKLV